MSNDSKTIARRMVRWASNYSPEIINRSCGYCMSGRWQDFYQKHLFPGKILDLQKLDDLVTCLHRRGYLATLDIIPQDWGMYLYMRMQKIET